MARLSVTALGGFQARLDGVAIGLPTRKSQALLAYLALTAGQAHPRDKLAALLWGGIHDASARSSLRQALFAIRKAVGHEVLRAEGSTVALKADAADVDAEVLARSVANGSPDSLMRAAELYRGDLLAGLVVDEAPFEEWLLGERERLRELALEALAKLLAHHRRTGATEAATQTALKLLTLDPLQEPVHRTLMRLYADIGRRGAALRQYQHCVAALQRELGTEPETETKALYQEILRTRPGRKRDPGIRSETPLIGRTAETAVLTDALDRAVGGSGGVVVVIGDAGIGKTRLAAELMEDAAQHGMTAVVGRAYESEQILPFGPWIDAFRALRLAERTALLDGLGPASRAELARLMPEIGAPPPQGETGHGLLFEAVARVTIQLAAESPTLLVLEDAHWADEMSARLIAYVARRIRKARMLVLLTVREDELGDASALVATLAELDRESLLTRLSLAPLSRPDTTALVRTLARTGDEAALVRLAEGAWLASEGNPFVVVEMMRAEGDGGALVTTRLALPDRVRELVNRRLDRLSEHAQVLTGVAGVIGREFDFALLHRGGGLDEDTAAACVEELVRRRVLHGVGERFDFTHEHIRAVAASRVLAPRRKLIHRRVAEAIETLYAPELAAHALALGLHYRGAEEWDRAARHLCIAGDAARLGAANREAVACFDQALACLRHLPEGGQRAGRIIDAILRQEIALMGLGEFERSLAGLREAEALAHGLGDRARLGRVFGRFGYNLGSIGDLDGATKAAEQARRIAIEMGDLAAQVSSNVMRARARYAHGDYRGVIEAIRENDEIARAGASPGPARANFWASRVWAVLALTELGEFVEAAIRADEALRLSRDDFGRHGEAWALLGAGRLHLVRGDLGRAMDVLERGLPLCEPESDLAVYFSRTAASLGAAYALVGRHADALALLERAAGHAEAIGFAYDQPLVVTTLAEAQLANSDVERARATADRALSVARNGGQRGWEAWTRRLQGEIALARGDASAAMRFREAAALAADRGMRPLLAHCRLGLARMASLQGDHADARAETNLALAEYRALAMPYWLARAEAQLADLS